MRRVWFLFKLIESMLGLVCLGYHARGFMNVEFIQDHYIYVAVFAGFTLMAMCGCLSICLKEPVSLLREGLLSMIAAILFVLVSLNSMYHAEKDFHLMYLTAHIEDEIEKRSQESDVLTPPHPFFKYSKAQSVAALTCGCLFLLHSILAFDMALSHIDITSDVGADELSQSEDEESDYMPYYVLSKNVHVWLDQFEWFNSLADKPFTEKVERPTEVVLEEN